VPTRIDLRKPGYRSIARNILPSATRPLVIRETLIPEAVARLAAAQPATELATPLEPPQPLYLHPAVFVPPRFPVA